MKLWCLSSKNEILWDLEEFSSSRFSEQANLVPVNRYSNDDNGPLNVNANWNFNNFDNRNPNIGALPVNDSIGQDIYGDHMYTKLFQKCYDLIKYIYPMLNKFPKSQRLIISQRIENTVILLLDDVLRLNYKDSKVLRKNISLKIQKLQVLFRISKDLSFLSFKKYEYVCGLLEEIRSLVNTE